MKLVNMVPTAAQRAADASEGTNADAEKAALNMQQVCMRSHSSIFISLNDQTQERSRRLLLLSGHFFMIQSSEREVTAGICGKPERE